MTEPLTPTDEDARGHYGWALAESARLRDVPYNRGDRSTWWAMTHKSLTKHAPDEEGSRCQADECRTGSWPCIMVKGAIADLRSGSGGW